MLKKNFFFGSEEILAFGNWENLILELEQIAIEQYCLFNSLDNQFIAPLDDLISCLLFQSPSLERHDNFIQILEHTCSGVIVFIELTYETTCKLCEDEEYGKLYTPIISKIIPLIPRELNKKNIISTYILDTLQKYNPRQSIFDLMSDCVLCKVDEPINEYLGIKFHVSFQFSLLNIIILDIFDHCIVQKNRFGGKLLEEIDLPPTLEVYFSIFFFNFY